MSDRSDQGKIVDLKDVRKKKASTKAATKGRAGAQHGNGSADAYERALRAQKGKSSGKGGSSLGGVRWFHYIQVIGLLLLVAWLMHTCHM